MKRVFKFMDSGEVQVFLGLLLMLSLFLADSWVVGNAPDSQNEVLYSILMFVVVIFSGEVIILSVVSEGYFNSFFFWMDFLGTLSILLDIGWVSNSFLSGGSVRRGSVLRATRAAKLGARYGRILRLMKLMKLTKWCPCLRSNVADDVKAEPTLSAVVKISNELTGTISRRVAMLVVTIVIVVPFLAYSATDFSPDAWMAVLKTTAKSRNCSSHDIEHFIHKFIHFYHYKDYKVEDVTVQSPYFNCGGTFDENGVAVVSAVQTTFYRERLDASRAVTKVSNLLPYHYDFEYGGNTYEIRATIDSTIPNQWSSLYGIILMILVIAVLFGFSGSFHSSIETLVVLPLQKLMGTLRKSATVMIDSLKSLEKEKKTEEKAKKRLLREQEDGKGAPPPPEEEDSDAEEDDDVEAAMLESLVEKLSKIVTHVLPSSNNIVANNENIDKGTADWLNQQYTSGATNSNNDPIAAKAKPVTKLPTHNEKDDDPSVQVGITAEEKASMERQHYVTLAIASVSKVASPEIINSYNFDVLAIESNEQCSEVVHFVFDVTMGFMDEFKIPHDVFYNFLGELSRRYINTNTYHNYKHAVDVFHTTYRLLMSTELINVANGGCGALNNLEIMSTLVAALGHDVGHMAVNNGFLVKTRHALAFQHNDKSPLENMHCVVLYEILTQVSSSEYVATHRSTGDAFLRAGVSPNKLGSLTEESTNNSFNGSVRATRTRAASTSDGTNIFMNLTDGQWRESRAVILNCILGTDMVHHFEQVKKTKVRRFYDYLLKMLLLTVIILFV